MKLLILAAVLRPLAASRARAAEDANPIQKAIELLIGLQEKIVREGGEGQKQYEEFAKWCKLTSWELHNEHEEGVSEKDGLEASLAKTEAELDNLSADIQELSGQIATDESDLKAATLIRNSEHADFMQADRELTDTIDTLNRAVSVMKKSSHRGAGFLQHGGQVPDALAAVAGGLVELVMAESIFSAKDKDSLAAILDSRDGGVDDDTGGNGDSQAAADDDISLISTGENDTASTKAKVGVAGILDTLQSLLEKAEAAQGKTRENEISAKHSFTMLQLSLQNSLQTHVSELDAKKKDAANAGETKAQAEGDLEVTRKSIVSTKQQLATTQQECMERAEAFSTEVSQRKDEMNALATAKKAMQDVSGLQTSSAPESDADSFLQVSSRARTKLRDGVSSAALGTLQRIRQLAQKEKSRALMQLASRIKAAIKIEQSGLVSSSVDPFYKVKSMIGDMIAKLEKEAEKGANEKEFCDREMGKTKAALDKKEDNLDGVTTRIDNLKSKAATLKEEIARLSQELGEIKRSQLQMRGIRMAEEQEYVTSCKDQNDGIAGIQRALKVLRDYYAKADSLVQTGADNAAEAGAPQEGGASGIIGLLEVAESDFTKSLAETMSEEQVKKDDYARITQELKVVQAQKREDAALKTGEMTQIDKSTAEFESDKIGVGQELGAIKEYFVKLTPKCSDATPWIDEDRHRRRDNIIKGLKESLATLSGDA